jgi:hypothetical protein
VLLSKLDDMRRADEDAVAEKERQRRESAAALKVGV